jgi:hypothetical protein
MGRGKSCSARGILAHGLPRDDTKSDSAIVQAHIKVRPMGKSLKSENVGPLKKLK